MYEELLKTLGNVVKYARTNRDMTVWELAEKSEVDGATISRVENARGEVTLEVVMKLNLIIDLQATELGHIWPKYSLTMLGQTESLQGWSAEAVHSLTTLFDQKRHEVLGLFTESLNEILGYDAYRRGMSPRLTVTLEDVNKLLVQNRILRYEIRYPPAMALPLISEAYCLGGAVAYEDFQMLLSECGPESEFWNNLNRQEREIIRRLQADVTERMKLTDVLRLADKIQIDLAGMYLHAKRRMLSIEAVTFDEELTKRENLISLFVILTGWHQYLFGNSADWVRTVRETLLQQAKNLI